MTCWKSAAAILVILIGGARAETAPAASQPAGPTIPMDLSTPQAAVNSYLRAWQSGGKAEANLKYCIAPAGDKAKVVTNDITHRLWRNYLERAAIAKFGATEGLKVLANARSFDEQLAIDIKRAEYANVDPDPVEKGLARVFLKPEKNPVWGNDPGEFGPRSRYVVRQIGKEWKIDYVKTYELDSQARTDGHRDTLDVALYPRVNAAFQAIVAAIKKGDCASADDAKAMVDNAWTKAYNEATGGKDTGDAADTPSTDTTKPDQPKPDDAAKPDENK